MEALLFAHSLLRWALLLLLLATTIKAFASWFGKKPVLVLDRKMAFWTLLAAHIQAVFGIILYVSNVKHYNPEHIGERVAIFWKFEHIFIMLLAVVLITVGRAISKKAKSELAKHRLIAIFYCIALVLILSAIPWPFREILGRQWL